MDFVEAGFNYRMTDFQAALVVSQFGRLQETLTHKRKLASRYLSGLKSRFIRTPYVPAGFEHTWQTFHLMTGSEATRDAQTQRAQ